jgi:hypothetical protein
MEELLMSEPLDEPRGHHHRRIRQAEHDRDAAIARAEKAEASLENLCGIQKILLDSLNRDGSKLTPEARLLIDYVVTRSALDVVEQSQQLVDMIAPGDTHE